jgi:3-oxoacyl-[acyl-carrier-protein] synthase III
MEYEIIDIQSSCNTDVKAPQLKQLSLIAGMLKEVVARNNIDVNEVENVFIQNCWIEFWKAVIMNVFRNEKLVIQDKMKDYGHGQSSDFVINLNAREEKGMVTPGRLQFGVGYGYGLHYSCVVFKKV